MTRKRIDWTAVRRARGRLEQLARAHPDLVGQRERDGIKHWEEILKKDAKAKRTQTAFRLPDELIDRLDRHVQRLRAASPGLEVTRADVVRMLLTKGLDDVESLAKKGRRP